MIFKIQDGLINDNKTTVTRKAENKLPFQNLNVQFLTSVNFIVTF